MFKIEIYEEKVLIRNGEQTVGFTTSKDGIVVSPDFTKNNRNATFIPRDSIKGAWGDYELHVSEPGKQQIEQFVYWIEELQSDAHQLTRQLAPPQPISNFEGDKIALLSFNRLLEWGGYWDIVDDDEEKSTIYLDDIHTRISSVEQHELELFLDTVLLEIDLSEARPPAMLLGFNQTTNKFVIPYELGYAGEFSFDDFVDSPREKLEQHESLEGWLTALDLLLEKNEV